MNFTCTLQLGILCVPVKFPFAVFRHWFQTQFWSKSSLPASAKQHGRGAARKEEATLVVLIITKIRWRSRHWAPVDTSAWRRTNPWLNSVELKRWRRRGSRLGSRGRGRRGNRLRGAPVASIHRRSRSCRDGRGIRRDRGSEARYDGGRGAVKSTRRCCVALARSVWWGGEVVRRARSSWEKAPARYDGGRGAAASTRRPCVALTRSARWGGSLIRCGSSWEKAPWGWGGAARWGGEIRGVSFAGGGGLCGA
jgi:hypothetical protein